MRYDVLRTSELDTEEIDTRNLTSSRQAVLLLLAAARTKRIPTDLFPSRLKNPLREYEIQKMKLSIKNEYQIIP